jgi:hypothetical protein
LSYSTALPSSQLLGLLPNTLKQELLEAYQQILRNFGERRWGPSELDAGKLCEIVYTILRGHVDGTFPARSAKPANMVDACRALENATGFPRSIRIQIPRMLMALYEIRNNRGVGHTGGEVDPNHMDAVCVLEMSKWIMSELVRIFHNVSTEEATRVIDALVERTLPIVWEVRGTKRVLTSDMSMKDKSMVLLYHCDGPVAMGQSLCKAL